MFTIFDDESDGVCCNYGQGSYSIGDADGISIFTGGEFGASEATQFCVPTTNDCEPVYDPFESNASDFALYPNSGGGYIAGSNSFDDLAKAQAFAALQQPAEISGIVFWSAAKVDDGGTVSAKLYALDGSGTDLGGATNAAPGTVLATGSKTLQRVDTAGFFNRIDFTNPYLVSTEFAVGLDFSGFSGDDEIGIVTNVDGDANGADMAWEKWSNGAWHSMNEAWTSQTQADFDLAIFPVVCTQNITGLEQAELNFGLYPNPNNGNFVLVNSNKVSARLSIFNAVGQVILIESISTDQDVVRLDVSDQVAGIYIVRIDSDKGRWTERLVIQ